MIRRWGPRHSGARSISPDYGNRTVSNAWGASTGPRTPEGWRGRGGRVGNSGLYSAEALAEQKRARELLAQSRELLKQMQASRRLHG
jgi:hypothetical protein